MIIENLTFIVTDDCNFSCSYCFQKKENKFMEKETISHGVNVFYPLFNKKMGVRINFYGGEPLLAFHQIKYATLLLTEKDKSTYKEKDKSIEFYLTTNGSLLTKDKLEFFNDHKFSLILSFDGLAQEKNRKKGTLKDLVGLIGRIHDFPNIYLEINSVFNPETVAMLSDSMRFIIEKTPAKITFNLSHKEKWGAEHINLLEKELYKTADFLFTIHQNTKRIPITNFFPKSNRAFQCSAGKKQISISPNGTLWGCFLFHDYFKSRQENPQYNDFYLGHLDEFSSEKFSYYKRNEPNYSQLSQDFFQTENTFCFLCEDLKKCMACPIFEAYSSGSLGKISCNSCCLKKVELKAHTYFHKNIKNNIA